MVLTDREQVINLAKNVDFETLALADENKLNEYLDQAIAFGKASAATWATSVNWEDSANNSHPSKNLYNELYIIYAAINLLMRMGDYSEETEGYNKMAESKGALLSKGVREYANYNQDGGASKLRSSASSITRLTYPANLDALPYKSPNMLSGRRSRG